MLFEMMAQEALPEGPAERDAADDFWYTDLAAGGQSHAGTYVSWQTAMRAATVMACVKILSETMAQLPCAVFERESNGNRREAPEHPLNDLLRRAPNGQNTAGEFYEMMQAYVSLRGNGVARIVPGPRGAIDALEPIYPDDLIWERQANGRVLYEYTDDAGRRRRLLDEEVMHVRALTLSRDRVTGLNPIAAQRETLGTSLAQMDYAARFYANDQQPGGVLEHPNHFRNDTDRASFRRMWAQARGGANRFKTALLEDGIKYHSLGMSNQDAQFLESRKYSAIEIAGLFRVPPPMLQILDHANYSNTVELNRAFVVHTVVPLVTRWEQRMNADLVVRPDRYFVEFNLAGLLRGDLEARYRAYAIGRNWGWLSVNDIRRLENMNPIEDGDTYLQPANMVPAGEPGEPSGMGRRNGQLSRWDHSGAPGNGHGEAEQQEGR